MNTTTKTDMSKLLYIIIMIVVYTLSVV